MSESFIFTPGKAPPGWTTPSTPFGLGESDGSLSESMNEMYVTAIGDDTHYFSPLEDTTLGNLHGLDKDDLIQEENATAAVDDNDTGEQVIVFNIEGSDDLYGIQFAPDEEGNIQKYQFKFRQTDQGTLEAMPETIEMLPNDDALPQNQQQLFLQTDATNEIQSGSGTVASEQNVDYDASGEAITKTEGEFQIFEEEDNDKGESDEDGNDTIKPVLLQFSGTNPAEEIKQEMFTQDSQSAFEEEYDQIITNVPDECFKNEQNEEIILSTPGYAQELNQVLTEEDSNTGSEHQYTQMVLGTDTERVGPDGTFIEESDNEEYEIEDGMHVTAEKELMSNNFDNECIITLPQRQSQRVGNSNILKQPSTENSPREKKKNRVYYLIPHPEKENFNSIMVNNLDTFKLNPRSVLKPQTLELKVVSQPLARVPDIETLKRLDKLERRRSRSKEFMEARLFNNFIDKTTIPHVPVRQQRLPRKQEIIPVDNRREEEIIVEEVMISSNGVVESVDERLKGKDKLEIVSYINLDDSDDENAAAAGNDRENVIQILSSDEEDVEDEDPPKRNGKKVENNDRKRDREESQENSSHNESSPSKKSRTESSGNDSDGAKVDNTCPHCTKSFPSLNSLKTHIKHHNLENRMQSATTSNNYKCERCQLSFKNFILRERHQCVDKSKIPTISKSVMAGMEALHIDKITHTAEGNEARKNAEVKATKKEFPCDKCHLSFKNSILLIRHTCPVCSICHAVFKDLATLNTHRRKHVKETMTKTTIGVHVSPKKQLNGKTNDERTKPHVSSAQVLKKFPCKNCTLKFTSRLLLHSHVTKSCVRSPIKVASNSNPGPVMKKECSKAVPEPHRPKLEQPNKKVGVANNGTTVTSSKRQLRSCTVTSGVTKK